MNKLFLHDTTLRDGDQTPGVNFSVSEKTEIARLLAAAGIDGIEAGFAAASPGDFLAVQSVAETVGKSCVVTSLARAVESDIDAVADALQSAEHGRIHVFLSTSPIHLQDKLKMTEDEAVEAAARAVAYARNRSAEVQFSAEDATRSDPAFLKRIFRAAKAAGATILNIPDTVGYTTPAEFSALVRTFTEDPEFEGVTFSVHCHNDLGMAAANTLSGIAAGAAQAECTVCGLGERAGNAALEQIALAVRTRPELYAVSPKVDTKKLISLARTVSGFADLPLSPTAPVVGANAFSHESGIHQHGMLANEKTYQIIDPALLGLKEPTLLLGKLSGRTAFSAKAAELGYRLSEEAMGRAFDSFLQLADRKKLVRDEEVDAILAEVQDAEILSRGYQLTAFSIQSNSHSGATADVTLTRDGKTLRDAAVGSGPIEAAFFAVERITLSGFTLDEYRIRAATEGKDALGIVQVRLKRKDRSYAGRGVSVDIIEASVKAYVNAINRAIYYAEDPDL